MRNIVDSFQSGLGSFHPMYRGLFPIPGTFRQPGRPRNIGYAVSVSSCDRMVYGDHGFSLGRRLDWASRKTRGLTSEVNTPVRYQYKRGRVKTRSLRSTQRKTTRTAPRGAPRSLARCKSMAVYTNTIRNQMADNNNTCDYFCQ